MIEMINETKRKQLQLHFLEGGKFKTNLIGVFIRTPLSRENATKTALIAEVLKNGAGKYDSRQKIAVKMDEMYGAVYDVSILKKGCEQILFFYLEILKCNEDLLQEGLDFLRENIESPLVDEKCFFAERVEREKKILGRNLKARKDDKRDYAKSKCLEKMFEGYEFGILAEGYEEDLKDINNNTLLSYYKEILEKSPIEIIFMGEEEDLDKVKKIAKTLSFCDREIFTEKKIKQRKTITKINEVKESLNVAQARLCIGFITDVQANSKEFPALMVFNEIFGGNGSSLLFTEVREKAGLCYYIGSFVFRMVSTIFVQAGISSKDFEKTIILINNVLDKLQNEEIAEQILKDAKDGLIQAYSSQMDSQTAKMDFYMNEFILSTKYSISDFVDKIKKVSVSDVKKVAQGVKIDTVYFLS